MKKIFFSIVIVVMTYQVSTAQKKCIRIEEFPKEEISEQERSGLLQMREEELMAQDVYAFLYEKWRIPIFRNITKSEQWHATIVKQLLDKYGIEDPAANHVQGEFGSKEIQKWYDTHTQNGSLSLMEAFNAGASIEDRDIFDLNDLVEKTDNQDIQFAYNNLKRGSGNHLRAFSRQLEFRGIEYIPEFISQVEYDEIVKK